MARQPKQNIDFTFFLKLNKEDRKMLDDIQLSGINASNLFREFIRKYHKDNNIKPIDD